MSAALITLTSNSNGPDSNRTGAPGSSGNCGACHGNNADATANISIEISDNGTPVSQYVPGKTYDLNLKATGNSSKIGFQLTLINSSNKTAGSITNTPSGTTVQNSAGQQYWGHSTPGSGNWSAKWTAPAAGTGDVRIFACLVLSNSNGNNGGDYVNTVNTLLTEESTNSINTTQKHHVSFVNPVGSILTFKNTVKNVVIWNNQGKVVKKFQIGNEFPTDDIPSGNYYIQYQTSEGIRLSANLLKL